MERLNRVPADQTAENQARVPEASFPELLSEFKTPAAETADTTQARGEALREADQAAIAHVQENLKRFAEPTAAPLTPRESALTEKREKAGQTYELRATERNKRRTLLERLFGRGKVTAEDMAREDAEDAYVKITDLKRYPALFGNGMQGPEYNPMARAKQKGASESRLAEVASETSPVHYPTQEGSFARMDAESVRWEKDLRRQRGLPTDVLDSDIRFQEAQDWERKQREGK